MSSVAGVMLVIEIATLILATPDASGISPLVPVTTTSHEPAAALMSRVHVIYVEVAVILVQVEVANFTVTSEVGRSVPTIVKEFPERV